MVEELLKWMNHSDIDEGIFAVGEISQQDVDTWLEEILKGDFELSLVFWTHNELVLTEENGTVVQLIFDDDRWGVMSINQVADI